MKKIISFLAILSIVFCLAACQKTPDSPIVVGKNQENMLEQASAPPDADTVAIAQQVQAPATYQYDYSSENGKLNIVVDATVIVPNADQMPIVRVSAADFTQEQVTALYDSLVGDTKMYEPRAEMTKSELENSIVATKQQIETEKQQKASNGNNNDADLIAMWEQQVKDLEKQYQSAPETLEDVPANSTLKQMRMAGPNSEVIAQYMGIHAHEILQNGEWGTIFDVQNNDNLEKSVILQEDAGSGHASSSIPRVRNASINFATPAGQKNFGQGMALPVDPNSNQVPQEAQGKLKTTPAQAKKLVEDVLQKTNTSMGVAKIELQDDEQRGNFDDTISTAENYVYYIECARFIDGVPCAEVEGMSFNVPNGFSDATAESWNYEKLKFYVNDDGVLSMMWFSPLEVLGTEIEKVQLLPFSDIKAIFEKMGTIQYEPQTNQEGMNAMEVSVDRIELSLMRIAEQNSIENGLLVPVWRFYGEETTHLQSDEGTEYPPIDKVILTVNAIDGSVIDETKGY